MTPQTMRIVEALLKQGTSRRALRIAFAARGATFIDTYHHGPYRLEALYLLGEAGYWTVAAAADPDRPWTQDELDHWLHDEIVRQLDLKLGTPRTP